MRYLYLGQAVSVADSSILGIFDLDNTSWSFRTRRFLQRAEQEGQLTYVGNDLPRSFLLCQEKGETPRIYLSQVNTATLSRRLEQISSNLEDTKSENP